MPAFGEDYFEIESVEVLKSHIREHRSLDNVVLQGLRLIEKDIEGKLLELPAAGSYFLGCQLGADLMRHVTTTGGTIFPMFGFPFQAYRSGLYTRDELMEGYRQGHRETLAQTLDGKIYRFFERYRNSKAPVPIMVALAFRIHDHAIDDALFDLLFPPTASPKRVVGIMGGHGMSRADDGFLKIARIARELTLDGYFIASGGGPGAMEAANLGSYFAAHSASDLEHAAAVLSDQPRFSDQRYIEKAYQVIDEFPDGHSSLAVPTWFYGHEPTNMFSTHIAKYFANSIREEGLLAIARHGVIFAPGSAGTVQEIFMDATQNHYRTCGGISPMVFLNSEFWTRTKPVYPLLKELAKEQEYAKMLTISDDVDEVVTFIKRSC